MLSIADYSGSWCVEENQIILLRKSHSGGFSAQSLWIKMVLSAMLKGCGYWPIFEGFQDFWKYPINEDFGILSLLWMSCDWIPSKIFAESSKEVLFCFKKSKCVVLCIWIYLNTFKNEYLSSTDLWLLEGYLLRFTWVAH